MDMKRKESCGDEEYGSMGSKTRGYDPLFRLKVKCFLIINKSPFLTSTLTIFPVAVFNAPCIPPNSRVRFFNGYFSPEVVIPLALGNANNETTSPFLYSNSIFFLMKQYSKSLSYAFISALTEYFFNMLKLFKV